MKKFGKILAAVLTSVMLIAAMCIPASAMGIFDKAKTIKSGKENLCNIAESDAQYPYKIKVNKSGTMKISLSHELQQVIVQVYDSDYNRVALEEDEIKTGTFGGTANQNTYWNGDSKIFRGTVKCAVSKGTYYIVIQQYYGQGNVNFTVTAPGGNTAEAPSCAAIVMKKGTTVNLAALVSGKAKKNVTLTTSDKKVAKVDSDGNVTAAAKGTSVITIKSGKNSFKIAVVVE